MEGWGVSVGSTIGGGNLDIVGLGVAVGCGVGMPRSPRRLSQNFCRGDLSSTGVGVGVTGAGIGVVTGGTDVAGGLGVSVGGCGTGGTGVGVGGTGVPAVLTGIAAGFRAGLDAAPVACFAAM